MEANWYLVIFSSSGLDEISATLDTASLEGVNTSGCDSLSL